MRFSSGVVELVSSALRHASRVETKMKLAQTNLSGLANGGVLVAKRLDCGGFSAALPRTLPARRPQSGDESPQSKRSARFVSAAAFGSSRRDSVRIARRFNAGIASSGAPSPAGTAEPARSFQPSLRDLIHFALQPGVETPGYCRSSLWDKTAARN